MKITVKILAVFLLLFFSAACTVATRPVSTTLNQKGTDSPKIQSTLSPTFTAMAPTFAATFTPIPQVSSTVAVTLTPTIESAVEKKCLQILPELAKDSQYSGKIVLEHPLSLYDVRSGEKYVIPNKVDFLSNLSVSPDRTMYAYEYSRARQLVIATSDHQIKRIVAIPDRWHLRRWQNDKNLLFIVYEPDPAPDPHWGKYPSTLGLLNPFSGGKQILPPDFPDIDKLNPILNFEGSGITVYDPTLSRVVYERGDWNVILWDIPNKKQLAQLPFRGLGITVPKWLPDGSKYIMAANDKYFYLVTREGVINQISRIPMDVEGYSWSPDNQHLAFWRRSLETEDRMLYLLDTTTGQISDLCITAGENYRGTSYPRLPVWSPDGSSIVVEANYNTNTEGRDLLLLNLKDSTVTKIGENSTPIGWLTEP